MTLPGQICVKNLRLYQALSSSYPDTFPYTICNMKYNKRYDWLYMVCSSCNQDFNNNFTKNILANLRTPTYKTQQMSHPALFLIKNSYKLQQAVDE